MRDQVLVKLAAMLRDAIAEDWVQDIAITDETSFNEDLELESIEFVALAERLRAEYGDKVDFAAWLADKELGEILGLRVGQVVDFIVTCLSSDSAA